MSAASDVLVLVGATATGKTDVAVEVAQRLHGEIISADSRAFFRGLDIVTAKPREVERGGVPHHLIDHVPFDATYDAMAFRRDVERRIPMVRARGRRPIIVGGGTLYVRALLQGLFEGPAKDVPFREAVEHVPSRALHERLSDIDPEAAETIHPNDRLRIVRALEVQRATGCPISRLQTEAEPLPYTFRVFGTRMDREAHRTAIVERTRRMIRDGLVAEVQRLLNAGLDAGMQAYRTIGVPEAAAHLRGELSLQEMECAIVRNTWSLARRQMAWFRKEPDVVWLDVSDRSVSDVAEEVCRRFKEMNS